MSGNRTEYQDRFWDYSNPFAIDEDKYEKLVQARVDVYGTVKKNRQRQSTLYNIPKPKQQQRKRDNKDNLKTQTNPKSYQRKHKQIYLHKNQSTFVSSETKPLRKTPKVILHLPSPAAASIKYEDETSMAS
ncbi:hypothetical protein TRFO_22454 [Tritrichomonas foetus]|uniref:Uncharacterized protein n=1 Tax=Tritrichomonas foetus TaxID=1144522 RepID=A0A1J4KBU1_9EUKA|nr:hypothetical protein TRFO_22454 [Tritrichomonas foetus]|eukprot:OHT08871.1 hypothetical protein TRFO_22454 [Tritrichomonas foetus]